MTRDQALMVAHDYSVKDKFKLTDAGLVLLSSLSASDEDVSLGSELLDRAQRVK